MLKCIYILLFSVAFTNTFQGEIVSFYLKYIMALIWISFFLFDLMRKKRINKKLVLYFKIYSLPYIYMFFWSFICFFIEGHFEKVFITRMVGQILYVLITYCSVVAAVHFFGKKTIKYSLIAMFLSTIANLLLTIRNHGLDSFINYLKVIIFTYNFEPGTVLHAIAGELEVQDITISAGIFVLYYIYFLKTTGKNLNKFEFIMAVICMFLGAKRTAIVAILVTLFIMFLIVRLKDKYLKFVQYLSFYIIGVSFLYVVIIKYDGLTIISNLLNINTMGRTSIYRTLAKYISISPIFLGQGFGYVDKVMFETIGFTSHSVLGKYFAEIGFIPFFIWLYYILMVVTKKIAILYGKNNATVYLICSFYIVITYFFENTSNLFCTQFAFLLIPLAHNYQGEINNGKKKNMFY